MASRIAACLVLGSALTVVLCLIASSALVYVIEKQANSPFCNEESCRNKDPYGTNCYSDHMTVRTIPVQVEEGPGFVVNRILLPMINEGIGILADGLASAEDIDKAMKLGAGHPMEPLALADLIGLDVCLAIMETLYSEFGDSKYRPHPLLRKMVRSNNLGMKTGKGFFEYSK